MKKLALPLLSLLLLSGCPAALCAKDYTPTPENLETRKAFENDRFGIFIHWGIYSMFGQGEWYLNRGPKQSEYCKAAAGFYPANFDAGEWADIFKDAGAKYITFTSRHHDGFSMYDTKQSDYNIVDATPYRRDVLKELSDSLADRGLKLHLYYSHVDWGRDDYPIGESGHGAMKDTTKADYNHYFDFMNSQLKELLTGYGPIRAIWLDGCWDHEKDSIPFDWRLDEQYELVHSLQPGILIGNNHHHMPNPGEDIQIFERDVPGENHAGYSPGGVSTTLPLETCQTMNGMWGYKVMDTDYKTFDELITLLARTAGKGANLLLNVGPQPDGNIPAAAKDLFKQIGVWMRANGNTIYGTQGSPFPEQEWGTATMRGKELFLHVLKPEAAISIPMRLKIADARIYGTDTKLKHKAEKDATLICLPEGFKTDGPDTIISLKLK